MLLLESCYVVARVNSTLSFSREHNNNSNNQDELMLGFCFRVVPVTDSDPVLFARPRSFSAKHVYLPSSDLVMFRSSKLPSGQMKILQS